VDYIHDGVGSDSAKALVEALAFDGEIAVAAGVLPRSKEEPYFRGWSVHDIALAPAAYLGGNSTSLTSTGDAFLQLVKEKRIDPMITRTIDLADLAAELKEPARAAGKTVIRVSA